MGADWTAPLLKSEEGVVKEDALYGSELHVAT